MYLGKDIMEDSQWKQKVRKEINICSILRISWGLEILTHTSLVDALEGRNKTLDTSCVIRKKEKRKERKTRIPWTPTRANWFRFLSGKHSKQEKKLCPTPHPQMIWHLLNHGDWT